jgi:hypothetical protein
MNRLIMVLFVIAICHHLSYPETGKYDMYISYNEQMHFRAGVNIGNYGIYVRPIFNKQSQSYYTSADQYVLSSIEQKGGEAGINLNRILFSYKKSEMILNVSSGFILSHAIMDGNKKYWEKAGSIAIVPEIRMFKKASLTLTPLYYRYNFPKKEINRGANGTLEYLDMRIMQMSFGLKFYY